MLREFTAQLQKGDNPGKTGPGRGACGGGVGKGISRPNGIDRGPQSGRGGRHQVKGRKRPPAQSNQRAARERAVHQKRDGHRHRTPGQG